MSYSNLLRVVACSLVGVAICVFSVTFHPQISSAADLLFSSTGSKSPHPVGQTFTIPVVVTTKSGEAINAISANISFPTQLLQLVSVEKTGTIINFWIGEPTFSNTTGVVRFEGGVYNPGFTGSNGKIVNLVFRAKAVGTAPLSFSAASVLANDGRGTNVLVKTGTASVTIVKAEPVAAPEPTSAPVEIPTAKTPILDPLPRSMPEGTALSISGKADPLSVVTVKVEGISGGGAGQSVKVDADGTFAVIWANHLAPGTYSITAQSVTQKAISSPSEKLTLSIEASNFFKLGQPLLNYLILISIILLLALLAISVWIWYLMHRVRSLKGRVSSDIKRADERVRARLKKLESNIVEHVQALRKEELRRDLTPQEEHVLSDLISHIEDAEEDIEKEIADIGR